MQTTNVIEGLKILQKYEKNDYGMAAEHDQIWAGPDLGEEIKGEDRAVLEKLGWFVDSECERWSAFV